MRLTKAIAAGFLLLGLPACGLNSSPSTDAPASESSAPSQAKDATLAAMLPDEIEKSGVIKVATDPGYPPFESIAKDGKTIVGLDPDLANAMGELLGVKVEFVPTSFDGLIPSLAAKKVDMAMSSIGDTKERENTVDFATYYWNGTLVLVKAGNPKDLKADMACGAKIGVIRGSLQQTTFLPEQTAVCKKAGQKPPESSAYQNGPQAQLALESNRIDGVMQDAPPVLDVSQKNPAKFEAAGPLVRNPNPGGVAFPKGSKLVEPVNAALNRLIENGTYTTTLQKWNLEAIKVEKSEINGAQS